MKKLYTRDGKRLPSGGSLAWDDAVHFCLCSEHNDHVRPTPAELDPHRRAGSCATAAARKIAEARKGVRMKAEGKRQGKLFGE